MGENPLAFRVSVTSAPTTSGLGGGCGVCFAANMAGPVGACIFTGDATASVGASSTTGDAGDGDSFSVCTGTIENGALMELQRASTQSRSQDHDGGDGSMGMPGK